METDTRQTVHITEKTLNQNQNQNQNQNHRNRKNARAANATQVTHIVTVLKLTENAHAKKRKGF